MPEKEKVRSIFSSIAATYDLLNHLLSLNLDRHWRKKLKEAVPDIHHRIILDHCAGTADLSMEIADPDGKVIGLDLSHEMLMIGKRKILKRKLSNLIQLVEGDSLMFPLKSEKIDIVAVAFGIRNLENLNKGFQEMFRVLKMGGCALILEFSKPRNPFFRLLYSLYLKRILPHIGHLISRHREAYHYLSSTIESFPDQEDITSLMLQIGFRQVSYNEITGGLVTLYKGFK